MLNPVSLEHRIIQKKVKEIERLRIEEQKWHCWRCKTLNSYTDPKTQVEKDECCVHVCAECGADEMPF